MKVGHEHVNCEASVFNVKQSNKHFQVYVPVTYAVCALLCMSNIIYQLSKQPACYYAAVVLPVLRLQKKAHIMRIAESKVIPPSTRDGSMLSQT